MRKEMICLGILLLVAILVMCNSCGKTKEEDMKIIKHNTEKLQTVFCRAYNSKESAKVLSQNLAKVVGGLIYLGTDVIQINGQSLKDWTKDAPRGLQIKL